MRKHKHESKYGAKVDRSAKKRSARNKNANLIVTCAAKRKAMQNTTVAKQEKHAIQIRCIYSHCSGSAPNQQAVLQTLLAEQLKEEAVVKLPC